jgi:hypothetical protein
MSPTRLNLPGILGDLARRGCGGAALILADRWGGSKRYIPQTAAGSLLEDLIGTKAAKILVEICGGTQQDVPNAACVDDIKAKILTYPGGTRECAQALGCTERWVREVRARGSVTPKIGKKVDARQPGLFDNVA